MEKNKPLGLFQKDFKNVKYLKMAMNVNLYFEVILFYVVDFLK